VVINQRGKDADPKANPEPNCLPSDEKINISVTIARKRARAKEHDNPDNEKSQHSEKKEYRRLTMHGYVERAFCLRGAHRFSSLGVHCFSVRLFWLCDFGN